MAYETELANISHVTDVLSDGVTPALVQTPVVPALIRYEPLPTGTNVKLYRKDGSFSAEQINESSVQAIDGAEQELTMTEVTATAVKLCASCFITVEALRFSPITIPDLLAKLGAAIGRDWEDEILALYSGFTGNTVTCASVKTFDDVLESAYYVRSGTAGVSDGRVVHVSDYKGLYELTKEQWNSGATPLSLMQNNALLQGYQLGQKGFRGERGGILFYETNGLPTSGSDDVSLTYDPMLAFGAMADNAPVVTIRDLGAGDGTRGFGKELSAYFFCDVIEWNDAAGCPCLSDT